MSELPLLDRLKPEHFRFLLAILRDPLRSTALL